MDQILKEFLQQYPSLLPIAYAGAVIVALGGVIGAILKIRKSLVLPVSERILEKRTFLGKVEQLMPDVDIDQYKRLFGDPVSKTTNIDTNLKEYVFVNKYFYLLAATDNDEKVKFFALTIRKKNFNPLFQSPDNQLNRDSFRIRLGVNKFCDLKGVPYYITGFLGAHTVAYYEAYYLGNPGHYREYGFGFNELGYFDLEDEHINWTLLWRYDQFDPRSPRYKKIGCSEQDLENLREIRSKAIINTYAITAPRISIRECSSMHLGIRSEQAINVSG